MKLIIVGLMLGLVSDCKSSDIFIRIFKQQKTLEIWQKNGGHYDLFKTYPICYFSGKLGPKEKQGDLQAPEGVYAISKQSLNPYSRFHLSFNIGYPNKLDRSLGRTGGYIMVHGDCVSAGCFAMTDKLIEEIYEKVESALEHQKTIPVHIFPFPLTSIRKFLFRWHPYARFWDELTPIYNYFETKKLVPVVNIKNKKYVLKEDV